MLTSSTILCAEANMRRKRGQSSAKERAKVFTALVCRGKIRSATRHACERDKGGVLMPGDVDSKTGDLVSETLKAKHPDGRDVNVESVPTFDSCPDLIDIQVTDDAVEEVAKHLSGSAGPSGIDSSSLSQWLLKHGGASSNLRKTLAKLVEWLANSYPPGQLIEL